MSIAAILALLALLVAGLMMLPASPFTMVINSINSIPFLAELNWFIPIGEMVAIAQGWLTAILAYYVVSCFLRWVKAIK